MSLTTNHQPHSMHQEPQVGDDQWDQASKKTSPQWTPGRCRRNP